MATIVAGLAVLSDQEDRKQAGHDASERDLVQSIYEAMRAEGRRRPQDG